MQGGLACFRDPAPVMHLQYTCNAPTTHLQCTCNTTADYLDFWDKDCRSSKIRKLNFKDAFGYAKHLKISYRGIFRTGSTGSRNP